MAMKGLITLLKFTKAVLYEENKKIRKFEI